MWYNSSVIINIYYEGISWHNLWSLWISIILSIYEYLNKNFKRSPFYAQD